MIGAGVIGAAPDRGWALHAHLPALAVLPSYRIAAVATTKLQSAAATARLFDVPHAFADAHALIEHPDVDLVTIAVKVPHHRELALAAFAAGKAVYCERPLGHGLAEAEEMAAVAKASGIRAASGLQGPCLARDTPPARADRKRLCRPRPVHQPRGIGRTLSR